MADGMVPIGIDNIMAISAMHAIKPGPSHYICMGYISSKGSNDL